MTSFLQDCYGIATQFILLGEAQTLSGDACQEILEMLSKLSTRHCERGDALASEIQQVIDDFRLQRPSCEQALKRLDVRASGRWSGQCPETRVLIHHDASLPFYDQESPGFFANSQLRALIVYVTSRTPRTPWSESSPNSILFASFGRESLDSYMHSPSSPVWMEPPRSSRWREAPQRLGVHPGTI
jgi:hypothetical protein